VEIVALIKYEKKKERLGAMMYNLTPPKTNEIP
jgi:hypothetical protein